MATVLLQVAVCVSVELSPTQRSKESGVTGKNGAGKDPLTGVG